MGRVFPERTKYPAALSELEEKTESIEESTSQIVEILARSRASQHLPAEVLASIARRFRPLDVLSGTLLCRQGEPGDALYAVERGTFAVEAEAEGQTMRLAERGAGMMVGEMAMLTGQPRTATVRALEDARVWVLDEADLRDIVRSHPDFGVDIAYTMSKRLTEEEASRSHSQGMHIPLAGEKDVIKIGRSVGNDIVIADPQVSRVHAVIQRIGAGHQIVDLNSPTGTYVNGERIQAQALQDGDEIWIASHPIDFDRGALTAYARPGGIRVDALDLTRLVGSGDVTLHDISLSIYPGELVCIVGASGAGKTTLLNALSGLQSATSGRVLYNGIDYYTYFDLFRRSLGYVPQDDIVHPELTVEQTLYYSARLRLPDDTSREEIKERISDVLVTLELTACRGLEVRSLSGGQRKRVSIGVELLTQPGIFYLDEPTSGLDPGLDARMMDLFRKLADGGRTVVLTTHATRNIMHADRVAFMARGGRLAFYGTPRDAPAYFGVEDFSDIYRLLELEQTPQAWEQRFRESDRFSRNIRQRLEGKALGLRAPSNRQPEPASRTGASALRQFFWLSARFLNILRRDRVLIGLLLAQAPIIAFALATTFPHRIFALHAIAGGDARQAIMLLFNLAVASIWLGASNAARAITEESAIYARERLVTLNLVPYVLSKTCILGLFSVIQSVLLLGLISLVVAFPGGQTVFLELLGTLVLVNLAGVGMGLLVSSICRNSLQATAVVVILIIPQLVQSGAAVALNQMSLVGRAIAQLLVVRWDLSLLGYVANVNARLQAQIIPGATNHYAEQFAINPAWYALILCGFFTLPLAGTAFVLWRKDTR